MSTIDDARLGTFLTSLAREYLGTKSVYADTYYAALVMDSFQAGYLAHSALNLNELVDHQIQMNTRLTNRVAYLTKKIDRLSRMLSVHSQALHGVLKSNTITLEMRSDIHKAFDDASDIEGEGCHEPAN